MFGYQHAASFDLSPAPVKGHPRRDRAMPAARLLSRPFLPAFLRGSGRRAQAFFRWLGLSAFLGAASLAAAVWDEEGLPESPIPRPRRFSMGVSRTAIP